jgi:hypothetical protein
MEWSVAQLHNGPHIGLGIPSFIYKTKPNQTEQKAQVWPMLIPQKGYLNKVLSSSHRYHPVDPLDISLILYLMEHPFLI